jgi:predicted nucleic acid-binding protein
VILADTSVWIDHFRLGDPLLEARLEEGAILIHPFVVGEIAMGNLRQRDAVLSWIRELPKATVAEDAEVLHVIESEQLYGRGVGYIDAHLIAAVLLTPEATLWTRDQALRSVAESLNVTER